MRIPISWLYVPADRPDRFEKAASSGADVIILDLEDAVAETHKDRARVNVAEYLNQRGEQNNAPAVHVRVNDTATRRGREDLEAVAGLSGLDALRLPKVHTLRNLGVVDDLLGEQSTPVHALVESAQGIQNIDAITQHSRVAGVALGEQDIATAVSITNEHALDILRIRVVVAAAAANVGPVPMSVFTDLHDEWGLRDSCAHGKTLGMFGRAAIHPRQIPIIRDAFLPTAAEIGHAEEVIRAAEEAEADGVGAFALDDGRFVDAPIVAKAYRTLALADDSRPGRT